MDFIDSSFAIKQPSKQFITAGVLTNLISQGIIPGIGGILIFYSSNFLFLFISF
jgi:ferrous iron transport protein B